MKTKIEAKNVEMQFTVRNEAGKKDTITVLKDFAIDVREGEFLAILGPSGCGKSTFLNILAGLSHQTAGDIKVDGEPVNGINLKQGVVFQGYALFPWRTVIENVEVGLQIRGVNKKERKEISRYYIQLVGLQGFENRYPHELSGGMRQRVAIARSLAYQPDLLLMDEPFAALDAQTREILQSELLRIWDTQKKTIIFITHSLDEAIFFGRSGRRDDRKAGKNQRNHRHPLRTPKICDIRNSEAFVKLRQRAWLILKDEVEQSQSLQIPAAASSKLNTESIQVPAKQPESEGLQAKVSNR